MLSMLGTMSYKLRVPSFQKHQHSDLIHYGVSSWYMVFRRQGSSSWKFSAIEELACSAGTTRSIRLTGCYLLAGNSTLEKREQNLKGEISSMLCFDQSESTGEERMMG